MKNPQAQLDALCDELDAFCAQHHLPNVSADELLSRLYSEETPRHDLCKWVADFIERWEVAAEDNYYATVKQVAL